jgi:YD repeat-containing protein
MFGPNWISTYEEQVFPGGDGTMKYARADGTVWSFALYGDPATYHLIAPADGQATLTEQGIGPALQYASSWTVTFQNGEQRVFSVQPFYLILDKSNYSDISFWSNVGRLVSITDRNGNVTTLTYNTQTIGCCLLQYQYTNLLAVTDPAGRSLFFNYGSGIYVTNVTSDPGRGINVTYTYGQSLSSGLVLTQVTQADNTFETFTYDANLNITSVNDTNGKVLESHTYDSTNRGLSSSRANGVEALAVAYQ